MDACTCTQIDHLHAPNECRNRATYKGGVCYECRYKRGEQPHA